MPVPPAASCLLFLLLEGTRHDWAVFCDVGQHLVKHVLEAFGKRMGLHDFRRSAGTHLALEAPEMIGILPGVLSHADPKTADRHYNIANSETASRRFGSMLRKLRHSAPIVRKRRIPETDPTEEEA